MSEHLFSSHPRAPAALDDDADKRDRGRVSGSTGHHTHRRTELLRPRPGWRRASACTSFRIFLRTVATSVLTRGGAEHPSVNEDPFLRTANLPVQWSATLSAAKSAGAASAVRGPLRLNECFVVTMGMRVLHAVGALFLLVLQGSLNERNEVLDMTRSPTWAKTHLPAAVRTSNGRLPAQSTAPPREESPRSAGPCVAVTAKPAAAQAIYAPMLTTTCDRGQGECVRDCGLKATGDSPDGTLVRAVLTSRDRAVPGVKLIRRKTELDEYIGSTGTSERLPFLVKVQDRQLISVPFNGTHCITSLHTVLVVAGRLRVFCIKSSAISSWL